jgi:hypothetical protein
LPRLEKRSGIWPWCSSWKLTAAVKRVCGLTVCVTGAGAGVDSAWEQRKPEARKMFVEAAESPASSAGFVRCGFDFTAAID